MAPSLHFVVFSNEAGKVVAARVPYLPLEACGRVLQATCVILVTAEIGRPRILSTHVELLRLLLALWIVCQV